MPIDFRTLSKVLGTVDEKNSVKSLQNPYIYEYRRNVYFFEITRIATLYLSLKNKTLSLCDISTLKI
jgi:hypothetical protein